jgi:hypothetical protein
MQTSFAPEQLRDPRWPSEKNPAHLRALRLLHRDLPEILIGPAT